MPSYFFLWKIEIPLSQVPGLSQICEKKNVHEQNTISGNVATMDE
jgi:hypothetical protein